MRDLKRFKLGVGPMSKDIVDLCLEWSSKFNYPIMIIASRNQADHDSGYAFSTGELAQYIRDNPHYSADRVLICRDHCGPYFSDRDRNLTLEDAVIQCFKTINADIAAGFDLIHIDVSRVESAQQLLVARTLIDHTISLKSDIMLEYGSEDNTGENIDQSIERLQGQLEFISQYRDNVKFIVSQTGSLTKHTQVGTFNIENNRRIAREIHSNGFLFKEHNADYLNRHDLLHRTLAGVDAVNIAPQLGSIQTQVTYYTSLRNSIDDNCDAFNRYFDLVLKSELWRKWVVSDDASYKTKIFASGHYHFNSPEYRDLMVNIDQVKYNNILRGSIFEALDEYRNGLL